MTITAPAIKLHIMTFTAASSMPMHKGRAESKPFHQKFWINKQIQMMTPLAQHHHPHHQSLRIFKIRRTHINCNQRRQELSSWQNANSQIIALQGTNSPWQK